MSIKTLRKDVSVSVLNSILANIQNQVDSYYYFVGRTYQWPNGDSVGSTTNYTQNALGNTEIRSAISYIQKVRADEVSLVTPRVDWQSGVSYTPYSTIGANTNTYITVDDGTLYNLFVCIDKTYGSNGSTVKPSKSVPGEVRTESDGYTWKHLYTIPKSKALRFMTSQYIPVQRALSDSFYNKGSIISGSITTAGAGYTNGTAPLTITGDGTGATGHVVISGGAVTSVVIDTPGSNYSWATLSFTSGSPTANAVITANFGVSDLDSDQYIVEQSAVAGVIDNIEMTNEGSGYIINGNINVTIIGDGTGAEIGSIVTVDGKIKKIELANRGSGYSFAKIVITDISGTGATAIANIAPSGGHGFNVPLEVPSKKLLIGSSIKYEYPFDTINQEFRIFGIMRNPIYISSGNTARAGREYMAHVTKITGTAVADEAYTDLAGRRYRCVYASGNDAHFVQEFENFYQPTGTLTPVNAGSTISVQSILSSPTINKYSGETIFLSEDASFSVGQTAGAILKTYIQV